MQPTLRLMSSEVARLHYSAQALATHGFLPELVAHILDWLLAFCARGFVPALWLRPQCVDWLLGRGISTDAPTGPVLTIYLEPSVNTTGQHATMVSLIGDGDTTTLMSIDSQAQWDLRMAFTMGHRITKNHHNVHTRVVLSAGSGGLVTIVEHDLTSALSCFDCCHWVREVVLADGAELTRAAALQRLGDALWCNRLRLRPEGNPWTPRIVRDAFGTITELGRLVDELRAAARRDDGQLSPGERTLALAYALYYS